jgi:electron transfer flavoprotein alpha subunit
MTALVYADHDNERLYPATKSAVTAAFEMDGDVHVVVTGARCAAVANEVARVGGVKKVIVLEGEPLANHLPEQIAPLLTKLAADYDYVVAPATSNCKNILPRVAAMLDVAQVSEITAVISSDTFERPIYAGNANAIVRSTDLKKVITVRATKFRAADMQDSPAPIETVAVSGSTAISRFIENTTTSGDRPELTSASVVVSGGRGMGSKDNFTLLDGLADRLNAAIGASRAAVDAGFAPSDAQVGQTGKVVAPNLYIAVGVSGAIQHLAGMKDSKVIVAINKDPDAPIFQVADVGLVGDLFEVLPQLTNALN